jgi:hypothetical protein
MVHEAGEPNAGVDFLDAELLAGQHRCVVDALAMQVKSSASGDQQFADLAKGTDA